MLNIFSQSKESDNSEGQKLNSDEIIILTKHQSKITTFEKYKGSVDPLLVVTRFAPE
jgi:hypothetical protein